ncbi:MULTISPECIES: hypothetical protein [Streptomyces]|jgi:hypothetical protein|uniref:hypothetical protein n=1 Tax=Streptomyces TaxID=1883 RepID=UPI0029B1438B|nr:hypothetical protein [Streptomyces sp. AK02-04a]MDX3764020.1 hypothetical protein [Streptomyces sp. AK02-04a]
MPSVLGLLEQRELAARRRVDALREEADRIQAELTVAELEWKEWAVTRSRVGEVLAPVDETGQGHAPAVPAPSEATAAKPKSQVPVWREGLAWSVLSVDYQRILQALADRHRLHQGPLTCQELAVMFGLDAVPAKVEALRSKAKRLVARGWLAERQPGRFTLAQGPAGQGGAS